MNIPLVDSARNNESGDEKDKENSLSLRGPKADFETPDEWSGVQSNFHVLDQAPYFPVANEAHPRKSPGETIDESRFYQSNAHVMEGAFPMSMLVKPPASANESDVGSVVAALENDEPSSWKDRDESKYYQSNAHVMEGAFPLSMLVEPPASAKENDVGAVVAALENRTSGSDLGSEEDERTSVKGVSVHWLRHGLLEEVESAGLTDRAKIYELENLRNPDEHGVIRRKGANVVCPFDGELGAAYVDCLSGRDNVGPSQVMLSYGWGNAIGDVVDTLENFCDSTGRTRNRTYVWICCLCNNQHRVARDAKRGKTVPFETFREVFHSRVTGIGHVVALMSPWDKPIYVNRVWCVFELYTADQNNCEVTVAMPPRDKANMVNALSAPQGGLSVLYDTLSGIRIENCQASNKEDRKRILDIVRGSSEEKHDGEEVEGYTKLNNRIYALLREWVKTGILEAVYDREKELKTKAGDSSSYDIRKGDFALFCTCVGNIFEKYGENDDAMELYLKALNIEEEIYGRCNMKTAVSLNNVGIVLDNMKKYDEALKYYRESLEIKRNVLESNHPSIARSHNNIGAVLYKKKLYNEALVSYQECLRIREEVLDSDHPHLAQLYDNIGLLMGAKGKYEQALEHHFRALAIHEKVLGKEHPETATCYSNLGGSMLGAGRIDEALEWYRKSLAVHKSMFGDDHPNTVAVENHVARARAKKRAKEGSGAPLLGSAAAVESGARTRRPTKISNDDDPSKPPPNLLRPSSSHRVGKPVLPEQLRSIKWQHGSSPGPLPASEGDGKRFDKLEPGMEPI